MPAQPAHTRLAPTPSGYLHQGNAVNFILVRRLADTIGASVHLRIDDVDVDRMRPEYVQDIFDVLHWLGIAWESGPLNPSEFGAHYSLRKRTAHYRVQAQGLWAAGLAYACTCSRRHGGGRCIADCRARRWPLTPGASALRLAIEPGTVVEVDGTGIDIAADLGDPVLWRRDDQVSYHLASVIEDRDHGITHAVRGEDLRTCSALHLHLAELLGATTSIDYRHHPLLVDETGHKLSKSVLNTGPMPRTDANRDLILARAEALAQVLDHDRRPDAGAPVGS